jgi:DNA-binding Lrp family transcriptional regulator
MQKRKRILNDSYLIIQRGGAEMVVAYVLLIVKPGEEANISEKLKKMKGIVDVSVVYGEYDIIAKIERGSMEDLQNFLIKEIRAMDEIERTSTMISLK